MENKTTIDKFLEKQSIDSIDINRGIFIIKETCNKIPINGEYDPAIIGSRIGEFIHAIMECGKLLATLGIVEKTQETVVEMEQAQAALERAPLKGFKTSADKKLYAQMDEKFLDEKQKLIEIQGAVMYIENCRTSLDKAQLHCKKIIDRSRVEERFSNDHERYSVNGNNRELSWVNEDDLK